MSVRVVTMYTRAAASDYDEWDTVYGNRGWGSEDLLPYLRKVSRAHTKLSLLHFLTPVTAVRDIRS